MASCGLSKVDPGAFTQLELMIELDLSHNKETLNSVKSKLLNNFSSNWKLEVELSGGVFYTLRS